MQRFWTYSWFQRIFSTWHTYWCCMLQNTYSRKLHGRHVMRDHELICTKEGECEWTNLSTTHQKSSEMLKVNQAERKKERVPSFHTRLLGPGSIWYQYFCAWLLGPHLSYWQPVYDWWFMRCRQSICFDFLFLSIKSSNINHSFYLNAEWVFNVCCINDG